MLTETEEGHAFAHPLLWEVVHDRVSAGRRMRLHQKAGLELEMLYGQQTEEHAVELAWHFRQGGDSHRALHYALLAGEHAENLIAGSEATQYYGMALELARELGNQGQLAQSLFRLGMALRLVGSLNEALPLFEDSAELYRRLSDSVSEALSLVFVADVQMRRGRVEETAQPLERVAQLLDSIGIGTPSPELANAYLQLGVVHSGMGRYSEALVDVGRAAEIASALGDERLLIRTELFRYEHLWFLGQVPDVLSEAESLLRRAESLGDSLAIRLALAHAAEAATYAGQFELAWEYRERELAVEERIPSPFMMVSTLDNLAWQARLRGEWEVAREHIQQALDLGSSMSNARSGLPILERGTLALWQGDWELASRSLEESVATSDRLSNPETLRLGQAALAELHLLQGQPEAAARRLEPVLDRPGLQEFDVTALLPILAWAYLEMGEVGRAEQVVAEGIKRALAQKNRLALVDALRVQGMMLARLGQWQEAKRAFEEAVSLPQMMPYPYAEARAQYEWGMMLVRKGEPAQARELLEEAAVIFRRLGANKDIDRTEHGLAQIDER